MTEPNAARGAEQGAGPDAEPSTPQHLLRRGVPIVILLAIIAGAWLYWGRADSAPSAQAAPAQQAAAPLPVQAVVVQPANVALRPRFLGQTEASQVVEIRSRVRGFL